MAAQRRWRWHYRVNLNKKQNRAVKRSRCRENSFRKKSGDKSAISDLWTPPKTKINCLFLGQKLRHTQTVSASSNLPAKRTFSLPLSLSLTFSLSFSFSFRFLAFSRENGGRRSLGGAKPQDENLRCSWGQRLPRAFARTQALGTRQVDRSNRRFRSVPPTRSLWVRLLTIPCYFQRSRFLSLRRRSEQVFDPQR